MTSKQSINDNNETINSEAFVSFGTVLTSKDGIIEIAGLQDVIVSQIVLMWHGSNNYTQTNHK